MLILLKRGGGKLRIVLFIPTIVVEGSPDGSGSIDIAFGSRGSLYSSFSSGITNSRIALTRISEALARLLNRFNADRQDLPLPLGVSRRGLQDRDCTGNQRALNISSGYSCD